MSRRVMSGHSYETMKNYLFLLNALMIDVLKQMLPRKIFIA